MSPPPPLPPDLADRYQILRILGAGAQGTVYAVHDTVLGRDCALKVFSPEVLGSDQGVARFLRECRVLAATEHPHLIRVFEVGRTDLGAWMLSELLDGSPLSEAPQADPETVLMQIGSALEALHAKEILHRDVKPDNIYWTKDGRAVLLDLGLAQELDRTALTATGLLVGTPGFMAPELFIGDAASPASDWYSLGATLYYVLERAAPYKLDSLVGAAYGEPLRPPRWVQSQPKVRVQRAVEALLSLDPKTRPSSVAALPLERVQAPAPKSPDTSQPLLALDEAPPSPHWKALALLFLVVASGTWWVASPRLPEAPLPQATVTVEEVAPVRVVVPPSAELRRLAIALEPFIPAPGVLPDTEAHLAAVLPYLRDTELVGRWRAYLTALDQWLTRATQGAETPEQIDQILMSPAVRNDFLRYVVELPGRFLSAVGAASGFLAQLFRSPTNEDLWKQLENRNQVVQEIHALYQGLTPGALGWLARKPSRFRHAPSIRWAHWWWIRRFRTFDPHEQGQVLIRALLPQLKTHPLGNRFLLAASDFAVRSSVREQLLCPAKLEVMNQIVEHIVDVPFSDTASPPAWANLLIVSHRNSGDCKSPAPQHTRRSLEKKAKALGGKKVTMLKSWQTRHSTLAAATAPFPPPSGSPPESEPLTSR